MTPVTIDQLLETALKEILEPMHEIFIREFAERDISFDEYVWNNWSALGNRLYVLIGEHYGDCDDAIKELLS